MRLAESWIVGTIAFGLTLSSWQSGRAQQSVQAGARQPQQDDVSGLRQRVESLDARQQQILDRLDELKQLLQVSAPRPGSQPPSNLVIHDELFKGNAAASVAIVEYADFQCPYCGKYEQEIYPQIFENY